MRGFGSPHNSQVTPIVIMLLVPCWTVISTRAQLEEGHWPHELGHKSIVVIPPKVRYHEVAPICDRSSYAYPTYL